MILAALRGLVPVKRRREFAKAVGLVAFIVALVSIVAWAIVRR